MNLHTVCFCYIMIFGELLPLKLQLSITEFRKNPVNPNILIKSVTNMRNFLEYFRYCYIIITSLSNFNVSELRIFDLGPLLINSKYFINTRLLKSTKNVTHITYILGFSSIASL